MKVRIEAKNISVDTISELYPNLPLEDGLRKCNRQWNSSEQKNFWNDIWITGWVVNECNADVLVFDTRMLSTTIHERLCPVVQRYVDKKQYIKVATYRKTGGETIITNIKAANIERITELYEKARNEMLQYASRRSSQRYVAGRSVRQYDLGKAMFCLQKLITGHEYDDPILAEALGVLQTRLDAARVCESNSFREHKERIESMERELQTLGAFHSTYMWRACRSRAAKKKS